MKVEAYEAYEEAKKSLPEGLAPEEYEAEIRALAEGCGV